MNEQTVPTNPGSQSESISLRANPRRFDPFVRRFYRLAAAWKTETGHLSNLTERCDHAAYRSIVEMGPEVVPLILAELENEPDYWFAALRQLTAENPVPPAAQGETQADGKHLARLGGKTWLYARACGRSFRTSTRKRRPEKSEPTPEYNCIAFAAGDDTECWWPNEDGYWPEGVAREETVEGFVGAFATRGYTVCGPGDLEPNFERIALYAIGDIPTHAARQLGDGSWVSKLGALDDIQHASLLELEGAAYGKVVCFLRRPATIA